MNKLNKTKNQTIIKALDKASAKPKLHAKDAEEALKSYSSIKLITTVIKRHKLGLSVAINTILILNLLFKFF